MSNRRIVVGVAAAATALAAAAALLAAGSTPAKQARQTATPAGVAKQLVGRWTGPKFGAEADEFRSDTWELVFERASGPALIGKKRHRLDGSWSPWERIDAVVDEARHIWAVDEDGTINGFLRGKTLQLVYQEPGTDDQAAAVVTLRPAS